MPLMPDDLLAKRFTTVRFTEGYLEDEVDSFLDDEVLPRLQELISENERLTKELEAAHQRIAELEAGAPVAAAPQPEEPVVDVSEAPSPIIVPGDEQQAEPAAAPVETAPEPVAAAGPGTAAGLLALAQETHDRYVREGEVERDRLLSEAQAEAGQLRGEAQSESERLRAEARSEHERLLTEGQAEHSRLVGEAQTEHDRLLGEARSESDRLVSEANETSRTTLAALEKKRTELEKEIANLETFERDYRNRLRNYLEEQLLQLDEGEAPAPQA
jgi:DivIVA domain-containing protein